MSQPGIVHCIVAADGHNGTPALVWARYCRPLVPAGGPADRSFRDTALGMAHSTRHVLSVIEEDAATADRAASGSDVRQEQAGPIGSVGAMLREGRRRHGLDIETVSEALRIRKAHLAAIEEGRFDDLPGTVYAIGFVRTYAEFLDLDAGYLVDLYKDEAARIGPTQALNFPAPVPENRLPVGAIALISLLLLAVGYGGWLYATSGDSDVATLVPELSERITELVATDPAAEPGSPGALPAPPMVDAARMADDDRTPGTVPPSAADPLPGLPALEEGAPQAPGPVPPQTGALAARDPAPNDAAAPAVTTPSADQATPPSARVEPSQALAAAPPVPPSVDGTGTAALSEARVVLRATADSWVQIRDGNGDLVMTRVMRPGEEYVLPDGLPEGVTMVTGNAGGLGVLLDGRLLPPLGDDGEVIRNISLDIADLAR